MQRLAKEHGLNEHAWFFQVERIAAERYGLTTTRYVSSLNQYYQTLIDYRDFLKP